MESDHLESLGEVLASAFPQTPNEKPASTPLAFDQRLKRLQDMLRAETNCKLCLDQGWLLDSALDKLIRCECMKEQDEKEMAERYLRLCALPEGSHHMTFENFRRSSSNGDAFDVALSFAQEEGGIKILTFMGGVDQGKTHLAIAICRRWLARGRPA